MSTTPQPRPTPPTEVTEKSQRRVFRAEYKLRILAEWETCKKEPGAVGAMLRREGLYGSHLIDWRNARDRGDLGGETRKRGPKPHVADGRDERIVELERHNAQLERRAIRAEMLVEFQKKVAEMLGALQNEKL